MDHIESTAELREVVEVIAWVILPEEKKGEEPWLHWLRSMQAKARAAITASMPVGNAAAMREALVAVKKSIDGIGESSLDCDPTILMAALTQVCARLSAKIERALSAPVRNCDRFATVKAAVIAFARERQDAPSPCPDFTFSAWLLAPATERKGDNDGK